MRAPIYNQLSTRDHTDTGHSVRHEAGKITKSGTRASRSGRIAEPGFGSSSNLMIPAADHADSISGRLTERVFWV